MRVLLALTGLAAASAIHVAATKKIHKVGKPETAAPRCDGSPNTLPLFTEEPEFVTKVPNGLKLKMSPPNYANPMTVLHVYGTQYEMGYAYGSMMKEEINWLVPQVYDYLDWSVNSSLPDWIPASTRNLILQYGVPYALNLTYEATKPYTPDWHYDTLKGMSDATGIDYYRLAGLSMVPELIKASCSIMGAWGAATAGGSKGLMQLRALDWTTDGPFQQYPVLLNWHPTNGHNFTALTWAGFLGAITGMSSTGMGVSEKVWLQYNGVENIYGYVWNFLLQDILQFDWDSDLALSRIASANRTCSIWIGLGDAANNQFRAIGYSNQEVNIWNDKNFPAYPNHDLFEGLVFIDKHVQWSGNPCMNDLMHAHYGSIDAITTSSQITALAETGNMHIAVMDFANSVMLVSNAAPTSTFGVEGTPAYVRQFMKVDMAKMWTTQFSDY